MLYGGGFVRLLSVVILLVMGQVGFAQHDGLAEINAVYGIQRGAQKIANRLKDGLILQKLRFRKSKPL